MPRRESFLFFQRRGFIEALCLPGQGTGWTERQTDGADISPGSTCLQK